MVESDTELLPCFKIEIEISSENWVKLQSNVFLNPDNEYTIQFLVLNTLELQDQTDYNLRITPNQDKFVILKSSETEPIPIFFKNKSSKSATYSTGSGASEDEVAMSEEAGETAGSVFRTTSFLTDFFSIITILLSVDQSGTLVKFSQISKLIFRLRMIDIEFGEIMGSFMEKLGEAFEG